MESRPPAMKTHFRERKDRKPSTSSNASMTSRKAKQLTCHLTAAFLISVCCHGQENPIQALPATFKADNGNEFTLSLKEQIEPEEEAVGLVADIKEKKLYLIVDAGREDPIELLFELNGKPGEGWRISPVDVPETPVKEITVRLEPKEDQTEPPEMKFPFRQKNHNLPEVLTDKHGNMLYITEAGAGNTALSHNTPKNAKNGLIMVDLPEPTPDEKDSDKEQESPFPITFALSLDGHAASEWEVDDENPKSVSITIQEDRMIKPRQVSMNFYKEDQGSGGQPNPSGEDEDSYLASSLEESALPEQLSIEIVVVPVALAVDANRDGQIRFKGLDEDKEYPPDITTSERPFRFWINDDDDSKNKDSPSSEKKDCDNETIDSLRDLEDFARLHLHIGGLHEPITEGDIAVGLGWVKPTNNVAIKLYQAASPKGDDTYLTNTLGSQNQYHGRFSQSVGTISEHADFRFPKTFWSSNLTGIPALSSEAPRRYTLFEGVEKGHGWLALSFYVNQKRVADIKCQYLSIHDIQTMYQSNKGTKFEKPDEEAQHALIFVHGWNMKPANSENFAQTMFKRLWHMGFDGRFAYFRWETKWLSGVDVMRLITQQYFANYNESEYLAWTKASIQLKTFVEAMPSNYTRHIAAHSMGNIVASQAINRGMKADVYVKMQSAAPAACYDGSSELEQTAPVIHKATIKGLEIRDVTIWKNKTPDDDPDDAIQKIAYRRAFEHIGQNCKIVNFHLAEDSATSYLWEVCNAVTKPPGLLSHPFKYDREANSADKLYIDMGNNLRYNFFKDIFIARVYACQTWAKTSGADGRVGGAIRNESSVDLSETRFQLPCKSKKPGFGIEHSGQFDYQFYQLQQFYKTLLRELDLDKQK